MATSGDYRRGVSVGGRWYAQIVDPRTGLPAGHVLSATVVAKDASDAGALPDFRVGEMQCGVSFKGPGYSAAAFIDRESGRYELTETRNGFVAVMNDLHKGRDAGKKWAWLIDASAVLMVLVSLTGIFLNLLLRKYRAMGLTAALCGAAASIALYAYFVP